MLPLRKKPLLTKRQQSALKFIKDFLGSRGYPPSLRELCSHLCIKGPANARKHLLALEKKGFLKRSGNTSRGIELASPGPKSHTLSVPIVGRVSAGPLSEALEDITGYVSLDSRLFPYKDAFLLRAKGESMVDAGIDDGDYILVRPQKIAANNDIVVAMLGGESTVKRFFKQAQTITLMPENKTMRPIVIKGGEFSIVGKVVSVIKDMGKKG